MGRMLAILIAILGFVATIWNTLSVEKKSANLEEADGYVSGLEQELESAEMHYRLAVQEFNFSTLHAANAYEIDRSDRLLGASVAPGTTMLKDAAQGQAPRERLSARQRVHLRREEIKLHLERPQKTKTGARKAEGVPQRPTPVARQQLVARQPIFSRIANIRPSRPATPANTGTTPTPRSAPSKKPNLRVINSIKSATTSIRTAVRPQISTEKKQQLVTIRGFQIENLSRWRQYMHQAAFGAPMSQEEVDSWEELLADALIEGKDPAIQRFADLCAESVDQWGEGYAEGQLELGIESEKKAALETEVNRGKSIYMGMMLVGLVLVTIKDVFGGKDD